MGHWSLGNISPLLLLLHCCIIHPTNSETLCARESRKLESSEIARLAAESVIDCALVCSENQLCQSFNYREIGGSCELNSKTLLNSQPDDFVSDKTMVYWSQDTCPDYGEEGETPGGITGPEEGGQTEDETTPAPDDPCDMMLVDDTLCVKVTPAGTYDQVSEHCTQRGMTLLPFVPKTVFSELTPSLNKNSYFWIGLTKPEGSTIWEWSDGTKYVPNQYEDIVYFNMAKDVVVHNHALLYTGFSRSYLCLTTCYGNSEDIIRDKSGICGTGKVEFKDE